MSDQLACTGRYVVQTTIPARPPYKAECDTCANLLTFGDLADAVKFSEKPCRRVVSRHRQLLVDGEEPIAHAVVGSTAYGLNHKGSDTDYLGVHIEPFRNIAGIRSSAAPSRVRKDPDFTSHEITKFVKLCLQSNPTVTELLWVDHPYVEADSIWSELVSLRLMMLSEDGVKKAYGGYTLGQAKRLVQRTKDNREDGFNSDLKNRTHKHARHCWRLLIQAETLLREGRVLVNVSQWREEIFSAGTIAEADPSVFLQEVEKRIARIELIESGALWKEPNRDLVERFLVYVRLKQAEEAMK